jgi:hypothetical protein
MIFDLQNVENLAIRKQWNINMRSKSLLVVWSVQPFNGPHVIAQGHFVK